MRTSYADGILAIEYGMPSANRFGVYPAQTGHHTAPQAECDMTIVTNHLSPAERATWSFVIVSDQAQSATSLRRKGFGRWFDKLKELTRLSDGWDSYAAPAPGSKAFSAAELYLSALELLGWEPARVEASAMGGIGITHKQGVRKVYVEFYNDGRVHALFSDRTPGGMQTLPVVAELASYHGFIGKAREYLNG